MSSKASFFDACAERWDREESPDMQARLQRVVDLSELAPRARVLDVGTGTGVLVPHLVARIGPEGSVVAIDISTAMLEKARAKHASPQVRFVLADIHRTGMPDASFDAVFCNAVFPHFDDKPLALAECARLLRPGGLLTISHPVGREAVNRIHAEAGGAVGEDRIPPNGQIIAWLEEAGFIQVEVVDEREFHFIKAVKNGRP